MLAVISSGPRVSFTPALPKVVTIRPEQLRALGAIAAESAEQRLFRLLLLDHPELAEDDGGSEHLRLLLDEALRRAPTYELTTELDLYRFTALMVRHGPWFDRDGRRPWIEAMLLDDRFDGTTRLDRLIERLEAAPSPHHDHDHHDPEA